MLSCCKSDGGFASSTVKLGTAPCGISNTEINGKSHYQIQLAQRYLSQVKLHENT